MEKGEAVGSYMLPSSLKKDTFEVQFLFPNEITGTKSLFFHTVVLNLSQTSQVIVIMIYGPPKSSTS